MDEIKYCDVPGYPNYRVGSDASVWTKKTGGNWKGTEIDGVWRRLMTKKHKRGEYLTVNLVHNKKAKSFLLHRLVLLCFKGPPPEGRPLGLHEDDNKMNNTPDNLYWGTHAENMKDAMRNGRTTRGAMNGCSVLTIDQVNEIIRLRKDELIGSRKLGRMFGVKNSTIQAIFNGVTWKYLDVPKFETSQADTIRGDRNPSAVLNADKVLEIVELYRSGLYSQQSLGNMFGVDQTCIAAIMNGRSWSQVTGIPRKIRDRSKG